MKLKRVLAVFMFVLAVALVSFVDISVFPNLNKTVSAAEIYGDFEYEVLDDGTAKIVKYTGNDETVNIPSEINGKKVTVLEGKSNDHFEVIDYLGVFEGNTNVKTVNIQNGVEIIGGGAFSGCKSLTSVNIPDSVTKIENAAFCWCTGLTSIDIPDSVTEIGDDSFEGWTISYNGAFEGCKGLTSINIPESVTIIGGYAFRYCTGLKSADIPEGVKKISDGAFSECAGLTRINIPESMEEIGHGAFLNCDSLKDVYFSGSETQWKSIDIGIYKELLPNATIHYNYSMDEENNTESENISSTESYINTTENKDTGNSMNIIIIVILTIIILGVIILAAVIFYKKNGGHKNEKA